MIMQAIRNEHSRPRPLYMLGEHWFKGYPGRRHAHQQDRPRRRRTPPTRTACCTTRAGSCSSSRRGRRAPASCSGSATSCAASGAAGSCKTALRAGVPIVPVAVDRRRGGDADLRPRPAAPAPHRAHLLPDQPRVPALRAGGAARCTCRPSSRSASSSRSRLDRYGPDAADDVALVQQVADDVRARIQIDAERDAARTLVGLVRLGAGAKSTAAAAKGARGPIG